MNSPCGERRYLRFPGLLRHVLPCPSGKLCSPPRTSLLHVLFMSAGAEVIGIDVGRIITRMEKERGIEGQG